MRPKKEDRLKRTVQLKICVTADEKKKIREHVAKEGFPTFSDFVRYYILKKREIILIEVFEEFRDVFRSLDYGLAKLSNNDLRKEVDALMKRMGYGRQPYFVYKHEDEERTHFHIVSTRIDVNTQKNQRQQRKAEN